MARGIAILLVLLGHTCPPPYTTAFIYAFHMPLFFVLSGLFFRVEPFGHLLRKEARTLLQVAFINQVIDQIDLVPLRDRLHYLVEKRFRGELNKCEGCRLCR